MDLATELLPGYWYFVNCIAAHGREFNLGVSSMDHTTNDQIRPREPVTHEKSEFDFREKSAVQQYLGSLFGFDFFISYAWADARDYAVELAQKLERQQDGKRYSCFLDSDDYAKGDNWKEAGMQALQLTSILVLIGSPQALQSQPVLEEIQKFQKTKRRIIPIEFLDTEGRSTLDAAHHPSPLHDYLPPEVLRIREPHQYRPDSQQLVGPSADLVKQLTESFDIITHADKRARVFGAAALVFAVVAVLAVFFWISSDANRRTAERNAINLARQLATAEYDRAHEASQPGKDPRVAFWYAYRAATTAPQGDPRCETYIDRTLFLATELPNKVVNLENWQYEPVHGIISPNLESLVVVTSRFDIAAWDLRSGRRLVLPATASVAGFGGDSSTGDDRDRGMQSLQISPNSQLALVLLNSDKGGKEQLCVWELATGAPVFQILTDSFENDYVFSADSRAVLQATTPDVSDSSPPRERAWKIAWHTTAAAEVGKTGVPAQELSAAKGQEVIYRGNRPFELKFGESEIGSGNPRSKHWFVARKSADGKAIACGSFAGYAGFWQIDSNPYVAHSSIRSNVAVALGGGGEVYSLDRAGTLTCESESAAAKQVRIRGGELKEVEIANIAFSIDRSQMLLCYRGLGPQGDEDYRGGFELRDADSLELLAEKRDKPLIVGADWWIKNLAWVGGREFVFVERGADSDYAHVKRASMDVASSEVLGNGLRIAIGEFLNLTGDGKYAAVAYNGRAEVLLRPTDGSSQTLGPFRAVPARVLQEAFDLRKTDQGMAGKLRPNFEFLLVNEPSGGRIFINGRLVNPDADVLPTVWNHSGLRGFDALGDSASVVDGGTGFLLGQFPLTDAGGGDFQFVRNRALVIGYANKTIWQITSGNELSIPPPWFASLGTAVTGLLMDDNRNLFTLPPAEHAAVRQRFLQALQSATAAGDQAAGRMQRYFGELQ